MPQPPAPLAAASSAPAAPEFPALPLPWGWSRFGGGSQGFLGPPTPPFFSSLLPLAVAQRIFFRLELLQAWVKTNQSVSTKPNPTSLCPLPRNPPPPPFHLSSFFLSSSISCKENKPPIRTPTTPSVLTIPTRPPQPPSLPQPPRPATGRAPPGGGGNAEKCIQTPPAPPHDPHFSPTCPQPPPPSFCFAPCKLLFHSPSHPAFSLPPPPPPILSLTPNPPPKLFLPSQIPSHIPPPPIPTAAPYLPYHPMYLCGRNRGVPIGGIPTSSPPLLCCLQLLLGLLGGCRKEIRPRTHPTNLPLPLRTSSNSPSMGAGRSPPSPSPLSWGGPEVPKGSLGGGPGPPPSLRR